MIAAAVALVAVLFLVFEYQRLQVTHTEIPANVNRPIRILHISDLHNRSFGKENRRLKKKIAELQPDIICYTGDLNKRKSHGKYHRGVAFLKDLAEQYPLFYAYGNHEVMGEEDDIIEAALTSSKVHLLRNEIAEITVNDEPCSVLGLDITYRKQEYAAVQMERFSTTVSGVKIVLCHFPHFFVQPEKLSLSEYPVDVILSGHAHGGQIRIFRHGIFAPEQGFFPKYTAGVYRSEQTQMVVNRGLGGLPIRVFNRPEIGVISLSPKK